MTGSPPRSTDRAPGRSSDSTGYLPALRFRVLTPLFDSFVRLGTREETFKAALIEGAGLQAGQRVLDLGAGTGTLAIMAKRREPNSEVVGLDADPDILRLARRKAAEAQIDVRFDEAMAGELPYEDRSFDHLTSADKRATLTEIVRVLRPGGELHIGDYTRAAGPLQKLLSWQVRLFDGLERTRENFAGELPRLLREAGLGDVGERRRLRTAFGTLGLVSGTR
jgi:SAM-dependent methyltransferase